MEPCPCWGLHRLSPLIADNNGLLFVETSALDSTNVEQAFETILKGTCTGAVVQRGPGDRSIEGSLIGDAGLGRGCTVRLSLPCSTSALWGWFRCRLSGWFGFRPLVLGVSLSAPHGFVLMAPGHPQSPGDFCPCNPWSPFLLSWAPDSMSPEPC